MPGNGRDPLDDWLDRGIQPLPPPAGTFEAIRKRARRRKMGKLAMAVSGAAAVVIATALVVPSLLAPPTAAPIAADSQAANRTSSPAPSNSPSRPAGTTNKATHSPSSAPSASIGAATGSTSGYPAGGAVPGNFQPTSVTFVGKNTGWAIGQAGTPGSCANTDPNICTSVVLTQDGGQTWRGVPAPDTLSVSAIRFLNGQDGWAYGPGLWSTHDYGQSWQQLSTGGMVVTDLETAGTQAYAVFATCSTTNSPSITFYGTEHCTDFTLKTTPAGSDNWTPITFSGTDGGTALTMSAAKSGATTDPTIVLHGTTGWLVGPLGEVFSGPLTSSTWTQVSMPPCPGSSQSAVGSAMLDWSLATGDLIMACNGAQATTIYSSADGGGTWTKQATATGFGTGESLTASPNAPEILATTEGIAALNPNGQWQEVASLRGGFSYVGMTTNEQGIAVPANPDLHQVWMTYDGGLSWTPHSIVP